VSTRLAGYHEERVRFRGKNGKNEGEKDRIAVALLPSRREALGRRELADFCGKSAKNGRKVSLFCQLTRGPGDSLENGKLPERYPLRTLFKVTN
jgi:hypothetical protein